MSQYHKMEPGVYMNADDEAGAPIRLVLERSRVVVQWRIDGTSLVAQEDDLDAILLRDPPSPHGVWQKPLSAGAIASFGEATPGEVGRPSWWVLWGNADPSVDVRVHIDEDDVPDPFVHRVGGVWACEWVSYPTIAEIHRSDRDRSDLVSFERPMFMPPAPHPEVEISQRKRGRGSGESNKNPCN